MESFRDRFRRSKVVALAVAVLLAVVGCGSSGNGGTAGSDGAPKELTIAISGGLQGIFASYAAAPLGEISKKFGVEFKLINTPGGAEAFAALAGGGASWCICGGARTIASVAQGQDVTAVFNMYQGGGVVLVGNNKYKDSIGQNVSGYAGKVWGFPSEGGTGATTAEAVARSVGINWDGLNRIAVGTAYAPTLQTGRADIVAMDPAAAGDVIALGLGYVVYNSNVPEHADAVGRVIGSPVVTSPKFLKQYPELSQAIVTALVQGNLAVRNADATAALKAMPELAKLKTKPASWEVEWNLTRPAVAGTDGSFTQKQIADTVGSAQSTGLKKLPTNLNEVFVNTYVDEAYKSLGVQRPPTA